MGPSRPLVEQFPSGEGKPRPLGEFVGPVPCAPAEPFGDVHGKLSSIDFACAYLYLKFYVVGEQAAAILCE